MFRKLLPFALIVLAAPATSQTLLDQLLTKAAKPRSVQPGQSGSFSAGLMPDQSAALDALLAKPSPNPRIAADQREAAGLIRAVAATGACATVSDAWNALSRYEMNPQTYHAPFSTELVPMGNLSYHDKRRCLDILRFSDWAKPANNALSFRVDFVAADSGEAKHQRFQLQKSGDGEWLIREIGVGLY